MLPHRERSCRSNFLSHQVTVYWHLADQSQHWPYNTRQYCQLRYRYSQLKVYLARRGSQNCVVYCLLPPTLVYFAVLQPGLFSVYCLIHRVTTRTTFICCMLSLVRLLTTAPAHVDKHIWPERKVIMCATFVVYVRSTVFRWKPLSKPGLFLFKTQ